MAVAASSSNLIFVVCCSLELVGVVASCACVVSCYLLLGLPLDAFNWLCIYYGVVHYVCNCVCIAVWYPRAPQCKIQGGGPGAGPPPGSCT